MKTVITKLDDENIYNLKTTNTTIKKEYGLTKEIIEAISKEKDGT